jgi:hypothetical protein
MIEQDNPVILASTRRRREHLGLARGLLAELLDASGGSALDGFAARAARVTSRAADTAWRATSPSRHQKGVSRPAAHAADHLADRGAHRGRTRRHAGVCVSCEMR